MIQYLEGVELLLQKESGSASFGTKVAPSLNGVDTSLRTQLLDPACRAKCSNILHDDFLKCFWGMAPRLSAERHAA